MIQISVYFMLDVRLKYGLEFLPGHSIDSVNENLVLPLSEL